MSAIERNSKGGSWSINVTHQAVNSAGRVFVDLTNQTADSLSSMSECFSKSTKRTTKYIKTHWKILVIYAVAWALVIVSSGILYGFQRTAKPLSIGMGAGMGFGLVTALLTTKVLDPKNKNKGHNTVVGWFAHKSIAVDMTTKQIAVTILVAVYLAACIKFPHATGGLTGAVIGNYLFVELFSYRPKNRRDTLTPVQVDFNDPGIVQRRMESLEQRIDALQNQLAQSEQRRKKEPQTVSGLRVQLV